MASVAKRDSASTASATTSSTDSAATTTAQPETGSFTLEADF